MKPKKEDVNDSQHFLLFLVSVWLLMTQSRYYLFEKRLHTLNGKTA